MGDDSAAQEPISKSLQELDLTKNSSEKIVAVEIIHSEEKVQGIHDEHPPEESHKKSETVSNKSATSIHKDGQKSDRKSEQPLKPEEDKKVSISELKEANPASELKVFERKPRVGSAASGLNHVDRMARNQSDIFSLKEQTTVATAIFSVNGSPSRKIYRRRELAVNNVFPPGEIGKQQPPSEKLASPRITKARDTRDSYNDLKRPSSSIRNPLTGTGLSSNDEYKGIKGKKRDGNPLLGLGYSPEARPSAHRIPPGGFSHKLW